MVSCSGQGTSSDEVQQQTDIVIIGAGVAGCIAALALAPRYSVTLIDKNKIPAPKVGECLPPAAGRIFNKLKLLAFPGNEHLSALGMASWWGTEQVQINDNLRNPDGFGWHVDRQVLEQRLREVAQDRGVQCYWPYTVASSARNGCNWLVNFTTKTADHTLPLAVRAKLVIDATGRHCSFARQQGVKRQQSDRLVSVWMTFASEAQNKFANICPVESGWWYCAPLPRLPGNNSPDVSRSGGSKEARVLAFQTDADLLPEDFTNKQVLWQAGRAVPELAEIFNKADYTTLGHHGRVAANSSLLSHFNFINWFAIGDAAMSFDPLSSQGMFNAMASAMQLSDLICEYGTDSDNALLTISHEFRQQLMRIWQYYQKHKTFYYSQERRWPESEFWRRRMA